MAGFHYSGRMKITESSLKMDNQPVLRTMRGQENIETESKVNIHLDNMQY